MLNTGIPPRGRGRGIGESGSATCWSCSLRGFHGGDDRSRERVEPLIDPAEPLLHRSHPLVEPVVVLLHRVLSSVPARSMRVPSSLRTSRSSVPTARISVSTFPSWFVISRSVVRVRSPAPIESTTYRDPDLNAAAVCHHGVTNHQAAGRHRHTTGPSRRGRLNSSYAGSAVAPRLVQVNCALAAGRQEAGYPHAVHAPVVRRPTRAPRLRPVTAPPRRSTAPPRATRRPALVSFPLLLQPPRPQARAGRRRRR